MKWADEPAVVGDSTGRGRGESLLGESAPAGALTSRAERPAAAPAEVSGAEDVPRLDASHLAEQIENGARRAVRLSRVTVRLHPPDLGVMHIAVESRDGGLSAHFHATHPAVHQWLETHEPALRTQLAEAGLLFQDLDFSGSSQQQGRGWPQEEPTAPSSLPREGPSLASSAAMAERLRGQTPGLADWLA